MYNVSERPQVDDLPGGEPVIVAAAPAMLEVQSMARRAAVGESKVLVTGESGVGKDLIARTIHVRSSPSTAPA
jgi:transcriptional regulator with PAS, ATPase and Fis domain